MILDASALRFLYELITSSIEAVPFLSPDNLLSKSDKGSKRPDNILLLVDLNCSIFAV